MSDDCSLHHELREMRRWLSRCFESSVRRSIVMLEGTRDQCDLSSDRRYSMLLIEWTRLIRINESRVLVGVA